MLIYNFLSSPKLHTKEISLSNIYKSLFSGSSVSIFSSYSLLMSDELHKVLDDDPDRVNSSLLSISDDDLNMEIFVIL